MTESLKRILIDMLGQTREGCEIVRQDGVDRRGDAFWIVRCSCGSERRVRGSGLRETDRRWECSRCRRPRTPAPDAGSIVKSWTVLDGSRVDVRTSAGSGRRDFVACRCNHCGYEHVYRKDSIPNWHRGCSVPNPMRGRRFSTRNGRSELPAGDDPQWARWSAELHMDPSLRDVWPQSRVENVEFWRENLAAPRVTLEEIVDRRRWVMS